jgi:ribulose-5-phosphate 4-epimerase/fuculose-1-phosphate aldolase
VDAYGHISFRSPEDPEIFVLSGNRAPALVSSLKDLIEYRVSDSSAVDPKAGRGFLERFIHSEIYKRFPEVNCVVHSHSEDVLPYVTGNVGLKPTFHISGFLGMFDFDNLIDS